METKLISAFLLLSALLPMAYLTFASGNVKRFFNNPTRAQVYSVLRYRWHFLGASLLLWLAGIVAFYINPSHYFWLDDLTGILLVIFTAVGLFVTGCIMFPAVRQAEFLSSKEIKGQLSPDDPVVGLELNGETRAYPIKWLRQSQIVEDIVGETPVVVTYCVACKTASAFITEFEGKSLRLIFPRHQEDKVMLYDSIAKRLIQQTSGEIIFGPGKGQTLPIVPVRIVPWVTWETKHPDSKVFYHEPTEKPFPASVMLPERIKLFNFDKEKIILRA